MASSITLTESAKRFITTDDAYNGISCDTPPAKPDNILIFTRTALRSQDYKNSGHHRHVLIFFLSKPGALFIDQYHYSAQEGQVVLIRPFQQHYYAPPSKNILWLFISFDLPDTQQIRLFNQPATMSGFIKKALIRLLQAYHAGLAQQTAVLLSCILYELGSNSHPSSTILNTEQKIITKINSYIHTHLNEPFALPDVARHCSVSVSYLRLRFKRSMGITLGHYIHSVRMNHAKKLLIRTNLTVSEITYQSGFSSPAVFCRAFKNETGQSALNFRKSKVK